MHQVPNFAPVPYGPTADGTDRILLDESCPAVLSTPPGQVVVLDDRTGALTLGLLTGSGPGVVRSYQDWLTSRAALAELANRLGLSNTLRQHETLDAAALAGATIVLLRLPKSLDALTEITEAVARHAHPDVVLYAAGPVKHLTRSMNDVLSESFASVRASLGRYKARALVATGPRDVTRTRTPSFPRTSRIPELDLNVVAHGGVFAGAKLDLGTRFLLDLLPQPGGVGIEVNSAVDLGCGTGILGAVLARQYPEAQVVVSDQSAAAVASAAATAVANGLSVVPLLDDALSTMPNASVDLVVCNPPFHAGTRLETAAAYRMFAAAARVLRPGGELWTVYNSHLRYRRDLDQVVGPTAMMGQNPKFTVTRSVRER